jgi:hypothetical protein
MTADLRQRRRILFTMLTALTFRYPSGREPALIPTLRSWLSGWPGIGRIAVGMARQGFDLQLTRYDGEGWRATFFPEGRAHSVASVVGSAWEREPWTAVQQPVQALYERLYDLYLMLSHDAEEPELVGPRVWSLGV